MDNGLDNILEETESKFGELNKKLEDMITNEQSVIGSFKRKIKKAIIGLLIIASISYGSAEAYKIKRKQDVLFENSRYYQVMEGDTLETIAEKVCNDSYNLNKIIEFNRKFDEDFDSIAEKGEIIHFPKKYVKNSRELINFIHEKTQLNKEIQKNKNFLEVTFNGNITKQGIDKIYEMIDELDSSSEKLKTLKQDNYFNNDAIVLLNQVSDLKENIRNKIDSEIEKIDTEFKLVNNIFHSDNWEKPGTLEKLEDLISRNDKVRYSYDCFRQHDEVIKTEITKQKIESTKEKYLNILDNIVHDVNRNKENIQEIENDLIKIFNFGIREDDISLLNKLTKKSNTLPSYELWKQEKQIQTEVNNYLSKLNRLRDSIDKKFFFAIESIGNKVNKLKEKNIIELTFGKDITKEKVRNIYNVIDGLKENKSKYLTLKNESYFKENPDDLLSRIENLETEIKDNIDYENQKAQLGFSKLKNELYNNSWRSIGTIEKLESLDTKGKEIRNFYYCFSNTNKIIELDDIHDYISSKKVSYLKILGNVSKEIEKNKAIVESLQKQIEPILKNGLQNKELPIINQLKNKEKTIKNYDEWIVEKRLQKQIQEYMNKKNSLNYELNRKFNYAVSLLNNELREFEKEVFDAEKLGRIESGTLRLKHILENNLYTIRHRYYLLEQKNEVVRTENLMKKIKAYIN